MIWFIMVLVVGSKYKNYGPGSRRCALDCLDVPINIQKLSSEIVTYHLVKDGNHGASAGNRSVLSGKRSGKELDQMKIFCKLGTITDIYQHWKTKFRTHKKFVYNAYS